MNIKLFKFIEGGSKKYVFRWTKKHYEFCMDNNIFLSHKGKKVYEERNFFLLSKGEKIAIEDNVIAEQYSTMPVRNFSSVGAFSFPTYKKKFYPLLKEKKIPSQQLFIKWREI